MKRSLTFPSCKVFLCSFLFLIFSISAAAQDLQGIFKFGIDRGWATSRQQGKWNDYLLRLSETDKTNLYRFLAQANTPSARFFVAESLLAGDDFTVLQKFITELNKYGEAAQQEGCLMTRPKSIIQQWENTCSVTTVQTYLGDVCPRYAWEVKAIKNFDVLDPTGGNPMGMQQKQLIEHYGGTVSRRGDPSGRTIGLLGPLNEWVGLLLGVRFYAEQVTESLPVVLTRVRGQLDDGLNVPLLIGFTGSANAHFILVMGYQYKGGDYQYLIYDPWDGVCNYVPQSNLLRGSLAPLNTHWNINVQYYYPATPLTAAEINELFQKRNKEFNKG